MGESLLEPVGRMLHSSASIVHRPVGSARLEFPLDRRCVEICQKKNTARENAKKDIYMQDTYSVVRNKLPHFENFIQQICTAISMQMPYRTETHCLWAARQSSKQI